MEGATFQGIVKYVMRHAKLPEARARYLTAEVLKAGIANGRIRKIDGTVYALAKARPAPVANKIREPNFDDDSSDASFDQDY